MNKHIWDQVMFGNRNDKEGHTGTNRLVGTQAITR